ncbi:leucine-rich repeat-containing protein 43 isoform X1 [Athene cunicularia]|uniref:leucine-rich repeat-containing protein 43 isoform X1 n=2 Tax=Athene cunicularia TaxID=194338 RepID=UPI000EF6ACF8|nr:leucine-rich repeat-containing protein 43 isoform X1 [Athene cunicularia]
MGRGGGSAGLSLLLPSPLQNKSRFHAGRSRRRGRPGLGADPAEQEEAVLLGQESPEARMELLRDPHSPWALLPACSPQDQHLREMAVLAPELVRGSSIFQVLRSLRIVGKGVEEVDEGLLQLEQLEELILSANYISRISSVNLPRTLKVLELCCNAVADLQDLCAQPPPELQHLGLGYNRLCGPLQDEYLTANFWPNLVSLDLSFNNFTDLLGLVSQLSSLQKLRVLVLQGNPLALIPAYRGFLVDSLPKLCILDDIRIGPQERHQFHALARQPELIRRSEARVVVSVGEIKGVPDPRALQQLEVGSQAPVITYSYCVTYEFVEGEEIKDGSSTEVTEIHQDPVVAALDVDRSAQDVRETKGQQEPAAMEEPKAHSAKVFVTPTKPWADTIDCSYRREHTAKDLVGLKSYLMSGTTISVVEEKVLSWPVGAGPEENRVMKDKARQRLQKDGAKVPVPRVKQKKEKPRELRSDPPIRRTLGTGRVALEALLATEDLVATVCDFGVLITEQPLQPPSLEETERLKTKILLNWRRVEGSSWCR